MNDIDPGLMGVFQEPSARHLWHHLFAGARSTMRWPPYPVKVILHGNWVFSCPRSGSRTMRSGSRGRTIKTPSRTSRWWRRDMSDLLPRSYRSERVEIFVPTPLVNRMVKTALRSAGVDLSRVTIRTITYSDVWIRDYGPTFVVNPAIRRSAMVRWEFNAWGEKYEDQITDGQVPTDMNRWLDLPVFRPGIILEGGSIDTNGRGTVLTTRACLLNPNRNPELTGGNRSLSQRIPRGCKDCLAEPRCSPAMIRTAISMISRGSFRHQPSSVHMKRTLLMKITRFSKKTMRS